MKCSTFNITIMNYKVDSPRDRSNKVKTIFCLTIIIASVVAVALSSYLVGLITLLFMAVVTAIAYVNIPRKIIVTDTEVILFNAGFKRVIPRSEIVKVRLVGEADKIGLWRKFGGDGLFGYFGIFSSKMHKTLYVYASQDSNWVLIETSKKKYVISPATTTKIIDILNPR